MSVAATLAAQQERRIRQLLDWAEREQAGSQRVDRRPQRGQAGRTVDSCSTANSQQQGTKHAGPSTPPSEQRILAMMQRLHPTSVHLALRRRGLDASGKQQHPVLRLHKPLPWNLLTLPPAARNFEDLPVLELPGGKVARAPSTDIVSDGHDRDRVALECRSLSLSPESSDVEVDLKGHMASAAKAVALQAGPCNSAVRAQEMQQREHVQGQQQMPQQLSPPAQQQQPGPQSREQSAAGEAQAQVLVLQPPLSPPHQQRSQRQAEQLQLARQGPPALQSPLISDLSPELVTGQELQGQQRRPEHLKQDRHSDTPDPWQEGRYPHTRLQSQTVYLGWNPFGNLLSQEGDPAETSAGTSHASALAATSTVASAVAGRAAVAPATGPARSPQHGPQAKPKCFESAPPLAQPPLRHPQLPPQCPQPSSLQGIDPAAASPTECGTPAEEKARGELPVALAVYRAWMLTCSRDTVHGHAKSLAAGWAYVRSLWATKRQAERHLYDPSLAPPDVQEEALKHSDMCRAWAFEAARQTDVRLGDMVQSRPFLRAHLRKVQQQLVREGLRQRQQQQQQHDGAGGPLFGGTQAVAAQNALRTLRAELPEGDCDWEQVAAAAIRALALERDPETGRSMPSCTGGERVPLASWAMDAAVLGLLLLDASPEAQRGDWCRALEGRAPRVCDCAALGVVHMSAAWRISPGEPELGRWPWTFSPMQLYHIISYDTFVLSPPEVLLRAGPAFDNAAYGDLDDGGGVCDSGTEKVAMGVHPESAAASGSHAPAAAAAAMAAEAVDSDAHRLLQLQGRFSAWYFNTLVELVVSAGSLPSARGRLLAQLSCSLLVRDWARQAPSLEVTLRRLRAVLVAEAARAMQPADGQQQRRPPATRQPEQEQMSGQLTTHPGEQQQQQVSGLQVERQPPRLCKELAVEPSPRQPQLNFQQRHQEQPRQQGVQQQRQEPPHQQAQRQGMQQQQEDSEQRVDEPQQCCALAPSAMASPSTPPLVPSPRRLTSRTSPPPHQCAQRDKAGTQPPSPALPQPQSEQCQKPPADQSCRPPGPKASCQSQPRSEPSTQSTQLHSLPVSLPRQDDETCSLSRSEHSRELQLQTQPPGQSPTPVALRTPPHGGEAPQQAQQPLILVPVDAVAPPVGDPPPQRMGEPHPHRSEKPSPEPQGLPQGAEEPQLERDKPPLRGESASPQGEVLQAQLICLPAHVESPPQQHAEQLWPQPVEELLEGYQPQLVVVSPQMEVVPQRPEEPHPQLDPSTPQGGCQPSPLAEQMLPAQSLPGSTQPQAVEVGLDTLDPPSISPCPPQQPEHNQPPLPPAAGDAATAQVAPPSEAEVRFARQLYAGMLRRGPRLSDPDLAAGRKLLCAILPTLHSAGAHGLLDAEHDRAAMTRALGMLRVTAERCDVALTTAAAAGGAVEPQPGPAWSDFVDRHRLLWKPRAREPLVWQFIEGLLAEARWPQLAEALRPGLLRSHPDTWGRLLAPQPDAQQQPRQHRPQQQACQQPAPPAQPSREDVEQEPQEHQPQQQQSKPQKPQGLVWRLLPGFMGLLGRSAAAATPAAALTRPAASEDAANGSEAGPPAVLAEDAPATPASTGKQAGARGHDPHWAEPLPLQRRQMARSAVWGLVALCGFDMPLKYLKLGNCLAAGVCMQQLLPKASELELAGVAAHAADLFRCLAFLPPLPYLPRDGDAWAAAVLPGPAAGAGAPLPQPVAELPRQHRARQQRMVEEIEYGIRLWLAESVIASLLTESVMPPSMGLAHALLRGQLVEALLERRQELAAVARNRRVCHGTGGAADGEEEQPEEQEEDEEDVEEEEDGRRMYT